MSALGLCKLAGLVSALHRPVRLELGWVCDSGDSEAQHELRPMPQLELPRHWLNWLAGFP